jgi:hypothetical protein
LLAYLIHDNEHQAIVGARPDLCVRIGVACCGARGSSFFMARHAAVGMREERHVALASATYSWEINTIGFAGFPGSGACVWALLRAWSPVPWRSTGFPSFSNLSQDSLLGSRSSHRQACPQPASVSCTVDSSLTTSIASQQTTSNHPLVCYRYLTRLASSFRPSYLKPWRRLPKHIISLRPFMSQTQYCRF